MVSMMTELPVKRMVQAETEKLRKMALDMTGMVVGQDEQYKSTEGYSAEQGRIEGPEETGSACIFRVQTEWGKRKWHGH